MDINKLAGWCLMIFGAINVLHAINTTSSGRGTPGILYVLVTALLFTLGAVFLIRKPIAFKKAKE